jgi:hypothetical protein
MMIIALQGGRQRAPLFGTDDDAGCDVLASSPAGCRRIKTLVAGRAPFARPVGSRLAHANCHNFATIDQH